MDYVKKQEYKLLAQQDLLKFQLVLIAILGVNDFQVHQRPTMTFY